MTAEPRTALSVDRPFPGLRPYAFEDSPFYFGREDQIYSLYRLLDRSHFIAVVGSSGSGKSSLVRAGLLPLLDAETKNAGGRAWQWVEMRPGDAPLKRLADALASLMPVAKDDVGRAINAARRERIGFALRQSSFGLAEALDKIEGLGDTSFVLVVDQFEELFRYAASTTGQKGGPGTEALWREDAAHFVQLLLEISRSRTRAVHVVITMRSDFIGDCAHFHGLPEAVSATQFLVPSLTRDQREEVIRKPIEKAGATIEPTLVERLLNDSGDELDQLPVVQHCLMRLWDRVGIDAKLSTPAESGTNNAEPHLDARHLSIEHYQAIGTIASALSQHAEEILASLPGLELAVEQVFRALAEVDRAGRAIRRAIPFAQLIAETGISEGELRKVVDRLRADDCSFLVPSRSFVPELAADTSIDVGHEALLRRWERLSGDPVIPAHGVSATQQTGWLRAEDADGRLYRGLLAFVDSEGGDGTTLPNDQVERRWRWWTSRPRTEAWAERYGGGFARVKRLFENSLAALEAARQAAVRQAIAITRRRHGLIAAIVIFALLAVSAAVYMRRQQQEALTQEGIASKALAEALAQKKIASDVLTSATKTANGLIKNAAVDFWRVGLPEKIALDILHSAQKLQSDLEKLGTPTADLRHSKAIGLNELATTFATLGYSDLATPAGNQARTILDQLLNEQPNNPQWQLDLADSHHAIGYSLYSNQQYDEAIKEYREGLAIRVKIAKAFPRPEWQILEAESYSAIGDALFDSNRREEALENYMNGLNIGTKVVADDKTNNPEWLARLSTSYLEIGTALPDDRIEEKIDRLYMGVELGEKATAAVPDNAQWRRDLSYGYAWLIIELTEEGHYKEALDPAKKGMEIVDGLIKGDLGNVRWQDAFHFIYREARVAFDGAGQEEKVREIDDKMSNIDAAIEKLHTTGEPDDRR
jgi:tetratricopeptide (TPR) repeat protein